MSEPRILVVGSTMVDLIAYAKRLPEAGETIVGDRFQIGLGGKGANQAVMAARFGVPVAMVNAVGDDAYGATHMKNFADEGIDTTWMQIGRARSSDLGGEPGGDGGALRRSRRDGECRRR